jgi:homoserine O-acetyltransferase/O-succinyltransferase
MRRFVLTCLFSLCLLTACCAQESAGGSKPAGLTPAEGDFTLHNFQFASGQVLPEVRMHYYTFGNLNKDANGKAANAVLILHGTSGSGRQFLVPKFAGVLFGPGQLLDANRYFIIIPDNVRHGKSSKPSDGMRAHFPQYNYTDMVKAQYQLVAQGLGVNHLRLILGTSMGCMHSFVWGESHPEFMDALMPLACLPVEIAGRNRMWRKMLIEGIESDPEWKNGDYTAQPAMGMRMAADMFLIATGSPLVLQKKGPTADEADKYLEGFVQQFDGGHDANDLLYAVRASKGYDPSPHLDKIVAHVMFINTADDFINPPELGIAEREIQKVKNGRFVLMPISDRTSGHSTHTDAAVWQGYLKELLEESQH